jgi:hypothetical protein
VGLSILMKVTHGHVIRQPSHVMFIGRNSQEKSMVIIFRQGHIGYAYRLGDSYNPKLCCKLSEHPEPGVFINKVLRKFPVDRID